MPETEELNKKPEAIRTGNRLNRRSDAEQIHHFFSGQLELRTNAGQTRSFVLNVDSDWGSGKTFFPERFEQDLRARGHVAVNINASEDEDCDDPFMTVVTALLYALEGTGKDCKSLIKLQ